MTKWACIRRRKERKKVESEERQKDEELQRDESQIRDLDTQQEKVTENVQDNAKTFLKRFSIPKKSTQQEKVTENVQYTQEKEKLEQTQIQTKQSILSHVPRYIYLLAFFALLSGVFYPLITQDPAQQNFDNVLKGSGILFLGLAGAILVYKGTTDKIGKTLAKNKKRATFVSCGFAMLVASLVLIFTMAGVPTTS